MINTKPLSVLALVVAPLMLSACGGSSGGPGGPGGPSATSFLGFSQVKPGRTTLTGIGREVTGTASDVDSLKSVSAFSGVGAVAADLTTDSNGNPTALSLTTQSGTNTWDQSNSQLDQGSGLIGAATNDGSKVVIVADPAAQGFEYQTFGAWATADSANSGRAGVFSVGAATDGASIPTSGTATFTGKAAGIYVDQSGSVGALTANASLDADFANRSATFSTTGSELDGGAASQLNMAGSMTYAAGKNAMSGPVSTASGMKGTVDGTFYGPGAAEAGGIFALKGTGDETLGGGFGTVKQ